MMKIGVKVGYGPTSEPIKESMQKIAELGMSSCQIVVSHKDYITKESADYVKECIKETGVEISSVWAGWGPGPCEWNFTAGPETLGLVPVAYRANRLERLLEVSAFTEMLGVENMITHVGFIPENMTDPNYPGVVAVLRKLCSVMKERGQYFLFETGQETPIVLLRTIEAVGTGNLGVNLDTANLILYGKANPVDALDVIGKYVRDTHCKDGFYPTCGNELGKEVRLGDGKVDFYRFVEGLHKLGYTGPLTIEREVSGEEQINDIIYAKAYLEGIKEKLGIE